MSKVFNFSRKGKSYLVAAPSKQEARAHLLDEYKVSIKNCFEVPKKEWVKPSIAVISSSEILDKDLACINDLLPNEGAKLLCVSYLMSI